MPNDEELLDVETEEEETEESLDVDETTEETDENLDDDIEYDDEGNVVIRGAEDDDQEPEKQEPSKPVGKTAEEYAALEERLRRLESQAKDTMRKLGVKEDDPERGLAKLAADADDMSVDDYLKQRKDDFEKEEALRQMRARSFQEKAARDLADLKAEYSGLEECKDIREIPNFDLFANMRDKGLTAKQAYAAANPDRVREQVASAAKNKALQDNKSHLRSSVPKGSKDTSIRISKQEMEMFRGAFPKLSDKEIAKIYRETKNK